MAEVKALKSVSDFAERHGFVTNCHRRSMKCTLGEYAGQYRHALPRVAATDCPSAPRGERALSKTRVLGPCQPRAPSCRHHWQTLSAWLSVQVVPGLTAGVMAWSAPSPWPRCRPLGAVIHQRAQHQRYPRHAPQTHCVASTNTPAR